MSGGWLGADDVLAFAYGLAALACLWAAWHERAAGTRRSGQAWPAFWCIAAGALLLMAVGRALDLGQLLAGAGRSRARAEGWYRDRRPLQLAIVVVVATAGIAVGRRAIGHVVRRRRQLVPAAIAISALVVLAAIRTVSLHWIDRALHDRLVGPVSVAVALELGLLGVVAFTAWHVCRAGISDNKTPTGHPEPVRG